MKGKKAKPLPEVELPDIGELSEGWNLTTLGEIGKWRTGGTPSRKINSYFNGDIAWVKSGDLKDGIVTATEEKITESGLQNCAAKLLPVGTVSVALYGATIGKVGILDIEAATNQACANCIVDPEKISKEFLFYFILSQRQNLIEAGQGGAQPNLTNQIIHDWPIPLPPLAEQQRIVARVEALLSHVNTARERLSRVPLIMKKFRQAVLAAACSGRLTEVWREENDVDESGNQLFDRIQKGRQNLFNKEISLAKTQNRCLQYKKPEFLGHPDEEKRSYLLDLPEEWIYSKLGNLGEIVRGASPRPAGDPKYFGGDVPWITVGEVTKDENPYLTTVSEYLTKQGKEKSRTIPIDTLLLTNSGATLGVPKITRIEGCINDGSVAILNIPFTSKLYLHYFLKSQTKALREINQGMGQPNLNTDLVREIVIPLPPLAEQHEIVRRVGLLFERADAFDQEVVVASRRCERLTQAVLGKAFRGELVTINVELSGGIRNE